MVDGVKDKIMSLFKTTTTNDYNKSTCVSNVYQSGEKARKPKIKKQPQDRIFKDIKNLYEKERNYYKPVTVESLYSNDYIEYESNDDRNITLSMK